MDSDGLVKRIKANFSLQLGLCREMEAESRRQLEVLQGSGGGSDISAILEKRRLLMARLDGMAGDNRAMQKQFIDCCGVAEFTLSGIKSCLSIEDWSDLKELITEIGEVLRGITAADDHSQALMARREGSGAGEKTVPVGHQQARQAYEKARGQKKP
jgi:hypothetical protein